MHVFISWSSENSKIIADSLSQALEAIFHNDRNPFSTFVSSKNIAAGAEWFDSIENNIRQADCAILCCTPENIGAPWVNFEAGACKMHLNENTHVIPLLIGMRARDLKPPLGCMHCVDFSSKGFKKLVCDINAIGHIFPDMTIAQIEGIAQSEFNAKLQTKRIRKILAQYRTSSLFSLRDIYPNDVTMVVKKSVYISSPMASLSHIEYEEFQKEMVSIQQALKDHCKTKHIFYPGEKIASQERFDGKQKAIAADFKKLRESEYLLVVYPGRLASSVLTEIGYAIALSKRIIIFVKDKADLPYMLQEADIAIDNFHLYTYDKVEDIIHQISSNGTSFLN